MSEKNAYHATKFEINKRQKYIFQLSATAIYHSNINKFLVSYSTIVHWFCGNLKSLVLSFFFNENRLCYCVKISEKAGEGVILILLSWQINQVQIPLYPEP